MAWTTPKTWAVNETVTAANVNTHLRDNLNWLGNDHPRCSAVRSTAQSIADNSATALSMTDADEFDVGTMHSTSVNPSRIVVPSGGDGLYHCNGYWSWTQNTAGRRVMTFRKTGVDIVGKGDFRGLSSPGDSGGSFSFYIQLVATDYMEMMCYQSSGGALNITGGLQLKWTAF